MIKVLGVSTWRLRQTFVDSKENENLTRWVWLKFEKNGSTPLCDYGELEELEISGIIEGKNSNNLTYINISKVSNTLTPTVKNLIYISHLNQYWSHPVLSLHSLLALKLTRGLPVQLRSQVVILNPHY